MYAGMGSHRSRSLHQVGYVTGEFPRLGKDSPVNYIPDTKLECRGEIVVYRSRLEPRPDGHYRLISTLPNGRNQTKHLAISPYEACA